VKDVRNAARVGRMSFLSDTDKRGIFQAVLDVLGHVGMMVYHPEAKELLREAGCRVDADDRVYVPKHVVERVRDSVPSVVRVYNRTGDLAMELGHFNSYFGTGSDLMSTYDLETGEHRPSTIEDVARAARLADALPNIDFVMSSAYPNGVDPHQSYLLSFATMMQNTVKPLVITAENGADLRVMCDLATTVRGGADELRAKPYFIVYNEPISPLEHPVDSIAKLFLCAEAGVPSIYIPAQMTGATAPITVAGHMTQGIAESLFGMVVHQLRCPGAPFVFGHGMAVLDMVTAQCSYNAVEGYMTEMGMVEMAKWLDIPNFGNAGTSDSQLVDAQAGLDIAELTLLVMQAGSNLNHDVGYLDFGLTGSLESIVITDEFIAMNRRLLAGIDVNRETLAVDVIAAVGPGGHFLNENHTRKHMRGSQWRPTILNRRGRDEWQLDGSPDLRERARRKALQLLSSHETEPLPAEIAASVDRLLSAFVAG
jgi:trimethylamine--corrinoid protein Co-methyltransferase